MINLKNSKTPKEYYSIPIINPLFLSDTNPDKPNHVFTAFQRQTQNVWLLLSCCYTVPQAGKMAGNIRASSDIHPGKLAVELGP